jgi:hypothetical protein
MRALAFTGLMLALTPTAFAAEPAEIAERLKTAMSGQGADIAWTGISGDGSAMSLDGVTIGIPGQPTRVPIGKVELSGITDEDGDVTIGSAKLPAYNIEESGMSVAIEGVSLDGLYLPKEADTGPFAGLLMYEHAEMKSVSAKMAGKDAFSLTDLTVDMTVPDDENGKLEFAMAADKFSADLSLVEDAQAKAVIDAMGYAQLNGSLEASGSWNPSDGRMLLDQYDITIDDAGTIGMTFDLGGYTPEFVKAIRDMQKKMVANPNQDQSAQGLAMLGLMQQITFYGATIRYDDDSLTSRALDFVATSQGQKPADIANQAKAILPFALAQLNNPELAAAVSTAVGKFLDDPKSIEIVAKPTSPLPVALIVATATTAPQTLPQQLGVTVTANED